MSDEQAEGEIQRGHIDYDIEDDVQDWKALNNLSKSSDSNPIIPKRGEKDFEPDGTSVQTSLLEESRNAMYQALGTHRGHHIKQKLVAVWLTKEQKAVVPHARGSFFKDIGKPVNFGKKIQGMYLNPIETVYLVERGSMIIYLGNQKFENFLSNDEKAFDYDELAQLSLSHLYSLAFSLDGDLVDKYQVYSYLKRHGYLIQEFKQRNELDQFTRFNRLINNSKPIFNLIFNNLINFFSNNKCFKLMHSYLQRIGLVSYSTNHSLHFLSKHYFNYLSIFKSLKLIPSYSTFDSLKYNVKKDPNYTIEYNVWKPTPIFSKKIPPHPDFQICIVNTDKIPFPKLETMQSLFNTVNYKFPNEPTEPKNKKPVKKKKNTMPPTKKELKLQRQKERQDKLDPKIQQRNNYLKLRNQHLKNSSSGRSIVIAIISNGVINFMNLSEGDFTLENCCTDDLDEIYPKNNHGIVWMESI